MNTYSFRKDLLAVQEELLRFAYKLTADKEEANDLLQETSLKALDNEDKYMPDTNFKGWMYTIMRNIFINNYRRIVREQTFVDQTDNLYHLNLPQNSGFANAEGSYDLKEIYKQTEYGSEKHLKALYGEKRALKDIVTNYDNVIKKYRTVTREAKPKETYELMLCENIFEIIEILKKKEPKRALEELNQLKEAVSRIKQQGTKEKNLRRIKELSEEIKP